MSCIARITSYRICRDAEPGGTGLGRALGRARQRRRQLGSGRIQRLGRRLGGRPWAATAVSGGPRRRAATRAGLSLRRQSRHVRADRQLQGRSGTSADDPRAARPMSAGHRHTPLAPLWLLAVSLAIALVLLAVALARAGARLVAARAGAGGARGGAARSAHRQGGAAVAPGSGPGRRSTSRRARKSATARARRKKRAPKSRRLAALMDGIRGTDDPRRRWLRGRNAAFRRHRTRDPRRRRSVGSRGSSSSATARCMTCLLPGSAPWLNAPGAPSTHGQQGRG